MYVVEFTFEANMFPYASPSFSITAGARISFDFTKANPSPLCIDNTMLVFVQAQIKIRWTLT